MSLTSKITDYKNSDSVGSKLRAKRIKPLLSIINKLYEKDGSVNILDIGGTRKYWGILPQGLMEEKNVYITLLNLPSQKKVEDEQRFKYLDGDACDLSNIANYSFDIVHSNSVIEHVGNWNRMLLFSKEVKRLAKNSFIQTPYFWFPIEPHFMTPFFHWLPRPIRVLLVMKFSLGNWTKQSTVSGAVSAVESAQLLDIKMFRELFRESEITLEKLYFFPKSLIAINCEDCTQGKK